MNEIVNFDKVRITSRDMATITNKRHADIMRDIRNEMDQIGDEAQRIFALGSYIDQNNQGRPQYEFGRNGAMQLALKYDAKTRFKVITKLDELEEISKPSGENLIALAVIEAQKMLNQKDQIIAEMKPKVLFADAISTSSDTILVRELAKLLKQNGINTGEKRLYTWLRENGYLIRRKGTDYNMPTQRSMELGLFKISETSIKRTGYDAITRTAKVTGKGQRYFIDKLCVKEINGMEIY